MLKIWLVVTCASLPCLSLALSFRDLEALVSPPGLMTQKLEGSDGGKCSMADLKIVKSIASLGEEILAQHQQMGRIEQRRLLSVHDSHIAATLAQMLSAANASLSASSSASSAAVDPALAQLEEMLTEQRRMLMELHPSCLQCLSSLSGSEPPDMGQCIPTVKCDDGKCPCDQADVKVMDAQFSKEQSRSNRRLLGATNASVPAPAAQVALPGGQPPAASPSSDGPPSFMGLLSESCTMCVMSAANGGPETIVGQCIGLSGPSSPICKTNSAALCKPCAPCIPCRDDPGFAPLCESDKCIECEPCGIFIPCFENISSATEPAKPTASVEPTTTENATEPEKTGKNASMAAGVHDEPKTKIGNAIGAAEEEIANELEAAAGDTSTVALVVKASIEDLTPKKVAAIKDSLSKELEVKAALLALVVKPGSAVIEVDLPSTSATELKAKVDKKDLQVLAGVEVESATLTKNSAGVLEYSLGTVMLLAMLQLVLF